MKPEEVWRFAPMMIPHLEKAIDHSNGEVRIGNVLDAAERGTLLLWVVMKGEESKAVFGTEFWTYPTGKIVLRVSLAGGEEMSDWLEYAQKIGEEYARTNGCHAIQVPGRPGWGRVLGYSEVRRIFEKEF